jgi:hypothetical protein
MFIENREDFEEYYGKFIYLYDRKKVPSGIVERTAQNAGKKLFY